MKNRLKILVPALIIALLFVFFGFKKAEAADCTIISAEFKPSGPQKTDWYKDAKRPYVFLIIKTKFCEGKTINYDIKGVDTITNAFEASVFGFNVPDITIEQEDTDLGINTVVLKNKAAVGQCNKQNTPDCQYIIKVWAGLYVGTADYDSTNKTNGKLYYDCDGLFCAGGAGWDFFTKSSAEEMDNLLEIQKNEAILTAQQNIDKGDDITEYKLLAPLPGQESTVKTQGTNALQNYLVIIFQFLIMIAGLLAVIMIVVGGIEYMSTDAMFGKEEGKERITQAIFGLLLALGTWLILNTVNPEVLTFGIKIDQAVIQSGGEPDTPHSPTSGTYCGKYAVGSSWPPVPYNDPNNLRSEEKIRAKLVQAGISVDTSTGNNKICTMVGMSACTSVAGLSDNALIGLGALYGACKNSPYNCQVVVTGGTECWLHSAGTTHMPGSATGTVDIRKNPGLASYIIEKDSNKGTQTRSYGKLYIVNLQGLNAYIVDEGNHYHVEKWN